MPPKKNAKGSGSGGGAGAGAGGGKNDDNNGGGAAAGGGGGGDCFCLPFPSLYSMARCLGRVSAYLEDPSNSGTASTMEELEKQNAPALRYAGHNFSLMDYQNAVDAIAPLSQPEAFIQKVISQVGVLRLFFRPMRALRLFLLKCLFHIAHPG